MDNRNEIRDFLISRRVAGLRRENLLASWAATVDQAGTARATEGA
jgi:hypothetical protein